MTRPVTLFTGQFADIPLAELAPKGRPGGATTAWSSRAGATTWTSTAPPRTAATPRAGSSSWRSMA